MICETKPQADGQLLVLVEDLKTRELVWVQANAIVDLHPPAGPQGWLIALMGFNEKFKKLLISDSRWAKICR